MDFVSIRVITEDPRRLVTFYEQVTGVTATWYTEDFAEVPTPSCTLAIAHQRTMKLFAADAARAGANRSVIIEFRVGDVDAEYRRLAPVMGAVVQEPTTMPWGNRSLLFRDPDGNLVNYFTPVTPAATERFNKRR
jgi:predicted enzyme related to lactoylglutathione lyase